MDNHEETRHMEEVFYISYTLSFYILFNLYEVVSTFTINVYKSSQLLTISVFKAIDPCHVIWIMFNQRFHLIIINNLLDGSSIKIYNSETNVQHR